MALANIFGAGKGWDLASTNDPLEATFISAVTARGEEIMNEFARNLARAIRNEIAQAWNQGRASAGQE